MAFSTQSFSVGTEDGWVLVATNPTYLYIRPDVMAPWALYVGTGAPAATDEGVHFKPGQRDSSDYEKDGATTAVFYVRNLSPAGKTPLRFGVIRDQV